MGNLGIAVLLNLCFAGASAAQSITVGFPEWPAGMNWLDESEIAAQFVRRAVTDTLVQAADMSEKGFRLSLADSLEYRPALGSWLLRLRKGALFWNLEPLRLEDVLFSLERCRGQGTLKGVKTIRGHNKEPIPGLIEQWVRIEWDGSLSSEQSSALPLMLADCPILEASSAEIFGPDLGLGTNVVSLGSFRVSGFSAGREFVLVRAGPPFSQKEAVESIVLRGFKDSNQALTALRSGTVDAFFTNTFEVLEKAKKDETLQVSRCSIYMIVHRKGFNISCNPRLKPAEFRY